MAALARGWAVFNPITLSSLCISSSKTVIHFMFVGGQTCRCQGRKLAVDCSQVVYAITQFGNPLTQHKWPVKNQHRRRIIGAVPMSTSDREMLLKTMQIALKSRIDGASSAATVADASFSLWQQMSAKLAPMIGHRGVDVLVNRAVHLTSASYLWLEMAADQKAGDTLLACIRVRLAGQDTATAMEASHSLLETFVDLLASLIGEPLTERLLGPVWAAPCTTHKAKDAP
jgi:hypothetical protein